MLYLDMGGDALTTALWCPPWPRTMDVKEESKTVPHSSFFLFRTLGINEQKRLLTSMATNLKQSISSLATIIHHSAKRHINY